MENIVSTLGENVSLNEIRKEVKTAYSDGKSGQAVFHPETVEALLDLIDKLNPLIAQTKEYDGIIDIFEVNNLIESAEVIGVSIEDVKEFAKKNKSNFKFDLSEYFTVTKSVHDYTVNIDFKDENHENFYEVRNINLINNYCNSKHDNVIFTLNAQLALSKENKIKVDKLISPS